MRFKCKAGTLSMNIEINFLCFELLGYVGISPVVAMSEPGEEHTPIPLFMVDKKLWDLSAEENDPIVFTDSFHNGAENVDAFDTGLMRLLSSATIELEYNFPTTVVAAV